MRAILRDRTGESLPATDRWYLLALLVGICLLAQTGTPRPAVVGSLLGLLMLLGIGLRWRVEGWIVVALLAAGVVLRFAFVGSGFSDVLPVTGAAAERVLSGLNPYEGGYANSSPPGAPFVYGPVALLWYLPFHADPRVLELGVSLGITGLLALRGRPLGLAVFALSPALLTIAADGANDTSAGLLLLVALVVAGIRPLLGGALLAVAVGFKLYAAAWLVPLVLWAGIPAVTGFGAATLAIWLPALLLWGPGPMIGSLGTALGIHQTSYYSLAYVLESTLGQRLPQEAFERFRLVAGGATALASAPFVRSHGSMILAGCLIYLATLFTGYWATFSYFGAIAPIVCWHLDDWLGSGRAYNRPP